MKIISIITEKGGVGKTTTSIHLGASFAELGLKVLLVDFDEQRNLSKGYKIEKSFPYNVKNFLDKTGQFRLTQKMESLFILSGSREIAADDYERTQLRERLNYLNERFPIDIVIIDCPPSPLSGKMKLGEIALSSSDYVISPIEAEEYSIDGINELLPEILRIKKNYNSSLNFLGFFFNKVNTWSKRYKKYSPLAHQEGKGYFLNTIVRIDESVETAKSEGKTVFQVAPKSRASEDYKSLAEEINTKIFL
ncbi:ParA family protein [Chryseobacterium sp.]|uniref:ParA family protein n=1 Tax=Chryseobacterium sp. TaxID=1871047 RepID=UPI00289F7C3F|nr:ParA family protein [Chryseobacterium sp.]